MIRAAAIWLLASPAAALTMPLPATVTLSEEIPLTSHRLATGPYRDGLPAETVEGRFTREIFRMAAPGATPLQLLAPLRDQIEAQGWDVVFTCADRACGGFLFRFEIDVAPAPAMFVDLAAYRYLSARKLDAWTSLVISTSAGEGYVQRITIAPVDSDAPIAISSASVAPPTPGLTATSDVAATLATTGRAVLSDLAFETGSTALAGTDYPSLSALADFMRANPQITVALVGHTDAEGGAEGNMAISRRRANSARALLTGPYGIAPGRVETHGVGFFAPVARNDTPEGRETNRRVEVVVTSTE